MNFINSKQESARFVKFAIVGTAGAAIDFGILNLLRIVFGLPLLWSQAISFGCAVINNFVLNRFWTYPDSRSKKVSHQLLQFFFINLVGILIRTPMITYLDQTVFELLKEKNWVLFSLDASIISQNIALGISIIIIMLWNYFANRIWTYSDIPWKNDKSTKDDGKFHQSDEKEVV